MRKIIVLLLTILMTFNAISVFASNEPAITVSTVEAKAGDTVDITVSISNNPGIAVMRLDVNYNKDVMTLTTVTDKGLLGVKNHSNDLTLSPYCLYWPNDTATSDYAGNGEAVTLTFKLNENIADGFYPISISYDYDNYDIYNVALDPIMFETISGGVTVASNVITKAAMNLENYVKGDTTTFTLNLVSPDSISGKVLVATYCDNKSRMNDVDIYDAISSRDISVSTKGMDTLKIFWWDGLSTLCPITEAIEIDLTK